METVSSTKTSWRTIDLVYSGLFASLMMVGANITSFAPFLTVGGVPITLQTFFAVLAGLVLGKKKGAIACAVYILIGLAGAPVFAKFSGGFSMILAPTFGFIITFVLIAYIAGWIVEKFQTRTAYIAAALLATFLNYVLGTNWMYAAYTLWAGALEGFTYGMAWLWMIPPMPKDFLLAIFAGIFAYRLQKTLKILPVK
ncbi:biotin transporter BioY [Bacillus sp. AGMB 02131]|uniref:Biotin transporter n=1 Tax=Peribacillus faecalis TaxID=2772559 RepID=A0A927CZP1_9BACI|nr:biotin transporter BioY [Peribacillus faecalis]MBD3109602.1 biotin transporter BioY [Peribacillus faecalis]